MDTSWIERVRSTVLRWRLAGSAWVVAVSGGSDSVGLLRVLHELAPETGLQLFVAHLDHGVRGEGARRDAEFVAGLAEELGLPFVLGRWQPTREAHFEADARRARYAWLKEIAKARGAAAIAVGHTRDDQAETILHRILRGTGPRGLAGIPARRGLGDSITLVRPLLSVSREELRAYLGTLGQAYRDDPTNTDLAHTRARIRHDLLPKLAAEYNPRVVESLTRLGELAGASHRALLRWLAKRASAATVSVSADAVVLLRSELARLPLALRAEVIRNAWRRAGWAEASMGSDRWLRLAALTRRARGRFSVGTGIDIWLSEERVRLSPALIDPAAEPPQPEGVPIPGTAEWDNGRLEAILDPNTPCDEKIDLDRLVLFEGAALTIRSPAPGDRFEPLGMDGRSMPLNDFLRGRGVPRAERLRTPLLCDRDGIVWVVGHRISQRVRVTEATVRTLGLCWTNLMDPEFI